MFVGKQCSKIYLADRKIQSSGTFNWRQRDMNRYVWLFDVKGCISDLTATRMCRNALKAMAHGAGVRAGAGRGGAARWRRSGGATTMYFPNTFQRSSRIDRRKQRVNSRHKISFRIRVICIYFSFMIILNQSLSLWPIRSRETPSRGTWFSFCLINHFSTQLN